MANNELSGPVVATFIGQWLKTQSRRYSYRIIFVTETIGSITYLSRHLKALQAKCVAGFNLTCIGDEAGYAFVASRYQQTLADRVARNVLAKQYPDFIEHSFLKRGSDERQYCSPGVDLPLVTLCRTRFGDYPEYHTSLDNLDFVTPQGLLGGFQMVQHCIEAIEHNRVYQVTCLGEPQLGTRGLYPDLSTKTSGATVETMMGFIDYADGTNDLIDISNIINKPVNKLIPIVEQLLSVNLIEAVIG